VHREKKAARAIEEAEIVVAGGAGIGNAEDWKWWKNWESLCMPPWEGRDRPWMKDGSPKNR